jgi:hypothetical protein
MNLDVLDPPRAAVAVKASWFRQPLWTGLQWGLALAVIAWLVMRVRAMRASST